MRLGITGLLPRAVEVIDVKAIRQVRELGFSGTGFSVNTPAADISLDRARELGRMFAGEGVGLAEFGQYHTNLISPDSQVRQDSLAAIRAAVKVAKAVGCPAVIAGVGSFNPKSAWFPHPQNHAPETLEQLVASLREAVPAAEQEGVVLALECHVNVALKDAATSRLVLDMVNALALKVHLDPVNWITPESVFDNGPAIAEMFAVLGPDRISGVHSKGVIVEDRLITHISETHTGAADDLIDHATILRESAKLSESAYLVIEHIAIDEMARARAHLQRIAEQIGVRFAGLR